MLAGSALDVLVDLPNRIGGTWPTLPELGGGPQCACKWWVALAARGELFADLGEITHSSFEPRVKITETFLSGGELRQVGFSSSRDQFGSVAPDLVGVTAHLLAVSEPTHGGPQFGGAGGGDPHLCGGLLVLLLQLIQMWLFLAGGAPATVGDAIFGGRDLAASLHPLLVQLRQPVDGGLMLSELVGACEDRALPGLLSGTGCLGSEGADSAGQHGALATQVRQVAVQAAGAVAKLIDALLRTIAGIGGQDRAGRQSEWAVYGCGQRCDVLDHCLSDGSAVQAECNGDPPGLRRPVNATT